MPFSSVVSSTASSTADGAFSFSAWDEQYNDRHFDALYNEMMQVAGSGSSSSSNPLTESPEFWWRLARVTSALAGNIDATVDLSGKREKVIEAKEWAEKALRRSRDRSFEGHLWAAVATGDLMLLTASPAARLPYLKVFADHLRQCKQADTDHWRVLLMEANLQLNLYYTHPQAALLLRQASKDQQPPPRIDRLQLTVIAAKLRRSLELAPQHLHTAFSLFLTLTKMNKYGEAVQVAAARLSPERRQAHTLVDEQQMAALLERWMHQLLGTTSEAH